MCVRQLFIQGGLPARGGLTCEEAAPSIDAPNQLGADVGVTDVPATILHPGLQKVRKDGAAAPGARRIRRHHHLTLENARARDSNSEGGHIMVLPPHISTSFNTIQ